jgi:hypothetical protein
VTIPKVYKNKKPMLFMVIKKAVLGLGLLLASTSPIKNNIDYEKQENLMEIMENLPLTYNKNTSQEIRNFIDNARKNIGTQYKWEGRLTKRFPNLDCLGAIFIPYSETFGGNWRDFSYNPSGIIKNQQLGTPVQGLNGVLKEDIDFSKFKEGDIIYFLSERKIKDKPLAKINDKEYWPWHTAIFSNENRYKILEASHNKGEVIERDIFEVLKGNRTKGVFVTRMRLMPQEEP